MLYSLTFMILLLFSMLVILGFQDSTDIIPELHEVIDCLGCVREAIIQSGFALLSVYIDCYEYRQIYECWASFANSPYKILDARHDLIKQNPNKSNAKIVVRKSERTAYLVATCDIKPNQEVLVSYGKRYVFHQNLEIC
jgi:hypothetical protein